MCRTFFVFDCFQNILYTLFRCNVKKILSQFLHFHFHYSELAKNFETIGNLTVKYKEIKWKEKKIRRKAKIFFGNLCKSHNYRTKTRIKNLYKNSFFLSKLRWKICHSKRRNPLKIWFENFSLMTKLSNYYQNYEGVWFLLVICFTFGYFQSQQNQKGVLSIIIVIFRRRKENNSFIVVSDNICFVLIVSFYLFLSFVSISVGFSFLEIQ